MRNRIPLPPWEPDRPCKECREPVGGSGPHGRLFCSNHCCCRYNNRRRRSKGRCPGCGAAVTRLTRHGNPALCQSCRNTRRRTDKRGRVKKLADAEAFNCAQCGVEVKRLVGGRKHRKYCKPCGWRRRRGVGNDSPTMAVFTVTIRVMSQAAGRRLIDVLRRELERRRQVIQDDRWLTRVTRAERKLMRRRLLTGMRHGEWRQMSTGKRQHRLSNAATVAEREG